ncbi:hypothetical protein N665_0161s0052 [Sinapis alba]|nr:hypothetical protein N665_0161s0052 [Sinapis alba]
MKKSGVELATDRIVVVCDGPMLMNKQEPLPWSLHSLLSQPTARTTGPSLPSHFPASGTSILYCSLVPLRPFAVLVAFMPADPHRRIHFVIPSALRSLRAAGLPVNGWRLQCLSSSYLSFSGGGAEFGGYNGRGGGGSDSSDSKLKLSAGAGDGVSVPSSDIIILNVEVHSLSVSLIKISDFRLT